MGFWQTGYLEFHEPVGLENFVPTPLVYTCKYCEETFTCPDELQTHRFENHKLRRPTIFIWNKEVGTSPLKITRPIVKGDIHISNCDHAWLNGMSISPSDIEDELVAKETDTVTVKLSCKGISSEFSLEFEIANEKDMEGVARCFFNMAKEGHLGIDSVEDFIDAAQAFPTASTYLDGICHYLYGVLAKERSPDSSLQYEDYREKFNLAENSLKDFNHYLGQVVVAIIRFHFNRFGESIDSAAKSRVGPRICIASKRFERWMSGDIAGANELLSRTLDTGIEELLTDIQTEELVRLCMSDVKTIASRMFDSPSLISGEYISELDRTKLWVMKAEIYADLRETEKAKNYARKLRNNPTFGLWAESLLERLTDAEKSYL